MCLAQGMRTERPWLERPVRSLLRTPGRTSLPGISWPIVRGTESLWRQAPNRGAKWHGAVPPVAAALQGAEASCLCLTGTLHAPETTRHAIAIRATKTTRNAHLRYPRAAGGTPNMGPLLQLAPRHASGAPLT